MALVTATAQNLEDPVSLLATIVAQGLALLGEDPTREGLRDTPQRVGRMLVEMTAGYTSDPAEVLGTVFTEPCDEMIVVQGVPFASLCEHHVLPFTGTVTLGYIPQGNRVVGLSKLPRLVQIFARRLQVQERMTHQIANAIDTYLDPLGVGVVIQGNHSCMQIRGIRSEGTMLTSCLLGVMRDTGPRAEFLALAHTA